MPKKLRQAEIDAVKYWLQKGLSLCDTAKKTSVSKTEIGRIRDTFKIKVQDTKRGQPSALTEKESRKAVRILSSGQQDNAAAITRILNQDRTIPISSQTLRNNLKRRGLHAVVKKKRPALQRYHQIARY